MNENTKPIKSKEEVANSEDEKIDQDFPNFPHQPGSEKTINPKTEEDKVNANLKTNNKTPKDDQDSVGSANAFEGTEGGEILREELDEDKDEKDNQSHY